VKSRMPVLLSSLLMPSSLQPQPFITRAPEQSAMRNHIFRHCASPNPDNGHARPCSALYRQAKIFAIKLLRCHADCWARGTVRSADSLAFG
jgi:hypothetical protein